MALPDVVNSCQAQQLFIILPWQLPLLLGVAA
jgi:hypothetical protein